MPEYTIIAKIDPTGVTAGRAKIKQELSGIEADAQRAGNTGAASLDRLGTAGKNAGAAVGGASGKIGIAASEVDKMAARARAAEASTTGLATGFKGAAAEASAMAAAAQASARGTAIQTAAFTESAAAARLNSVAMRETLVVGRELARGNFTRLPGSLTLLGQGIASQGGITAYATSLANTLGLLKTTQNAELALAAQDTATALAGVRGAAERAAANVAAADTEVALARAQLSVAESAAAAELAQSRLAKSTTAVKAAAAELAFAEEAVATAEAEAGAAAVASAEAMTVGLNPVAVVIGVVAAAAAALYFAFRDTEDAAHKAADKLQENANKAKVAADAQDIFAHTLAGVEEALKKNKEAIDKANEANRTGAEQEMLNAKIQELYLQRIYDETDATLELAKARLAAANAVQYGAGGGAGAYGAQQIYQGQVDQLQGELDKNRAARAAAAAEYDAALAQETVEAGERDTAERIKNMYEGLNGLIPKAREAATAAAAMARAAGLEKTAHELVTTELGKQVVLLHAKEQAEIAAAQRADADAKKQGAILPLPIEGGTIGTRFGQMETGVGVGPHAHQGVDIRTPVGTPVYARAGGTVDYAREEHGYGNIIQINFGGGVTGRFAHLEKFNVKPGDVVQAGDVIGLSGGARGAPGSGDATGPHLHYEERVSGHPVNPLTTKVQIDTAGAQQAGYKKAEEAAASAAKKAADEKAFVDRTIDAANETALPRIETLTAKIKKVTDDYAHQFKEALNPTQLKNITDALTAADARTTAQHFDEAYVQPLKALQAALGETAVERQISNATIKEEHDLGKSLSAAQQKEIDDRYRQGDVLERENKILTDIRQPLEDYKQQLAALIDLLSKGEITQKQFNSRVAELGSAATGVLKNLPGVDPVSHRPFADVAARQEVTAAEAQRQDQIESLKNQNTLTADNSLLQTGDWENYHKTLLDIQKQYEAQMLASHQKYTDDLNGVDSARRDLQLSYGEQIADSIYQIAVSAFGKQSAIARAAFGVEKAFTIARASLALYNDVAQAMKYGFPDNLPFIAAAFAQGATIIGAIRSIVAPSATGYMGGGYTGDGNTGDVAGLVHGREFVVNADATSRNRALLEAINSGAVTARSRSISNDNSPSGMRPLNVQVHNYAGADIEVQRGLTVDDVVVIAKKTTRDEAPKAVADDLAKPNGRTSKAMTRHFATSRSRR